MPASGSDYQSFTRFSAPVESGRPTWIERKGTVQGAPSVRLPATAVPGGTLPIFLTRVPGESFEERYESFELRSLAGIIITRAFPIPFRLGRGFELTAYLVAIDSTVSPGRYEVAAVRGDGRRESVVTISVVPYEFRNQEIVLNRTLTRLRAEPDPEKTRQTRVLTELILSRDPAALYHYGPLVWPLPAGTRETSLFGDRRIYLYDDGSRARTIHVGLDLAAPTGTDVVSAGRGIVRMATFRIITGGTVVIEHLPGIYSLYYHLHDISVAAGAVVEAGESIGTVGSTGLSTGAHLHWEVRVGGVPVSPKPLTVTPLLTLPQLVDTEPDI
ncbi:MAG: M23 family metallopeptidase [Spirochaetales bacterium]